MGLPRRSGLRVLVAAAVCSASPVVAAPETAQPHWDMISFTMKSWGAPLTIWNILPDGSGGFAEAVHEEGAPPIGPAPMAWHELPADAGHYAKLVAILERLPEEAPNAMECENFMTDAPYGTLRLTRGATTTEIAWNSGCMDDDYRAFMSVLGDANNLVGEVGKAQPVSRTDPAPEN